MSPESSDLGMQGFTPMAYAPIVIGNRITTGQPYRPVARQVQWGKYFAFQHAFTGATILASGARGSRVVLQMPGDFDFYVMKISCLADNYAVKVRHEITSVSEGFETVPVYLSNFGTGRLPLQINPAWILPRNSIFTLIADDRQLIAGTNNVRVVYHGAKVSPFPLVPARRYHRAKQYIYPANFTADDDGTGALTASSQQIFTRRIDGEADFEVQKITIVSDGACQFNVQSDSDNWFSTDLRSELFGGTTIETPPFGASGEYPFILPAPRIVSAGGYLATTVTDLSVATNRVQILYHGVRLYPAGGL